MPAPAKRKYLLADRSKSDRSGLFRIAAARVFDGSLTDAPAAGGFDASTWQLFSANFYKKRQEFSAIFAQRRRKISAAC